MVAWLHRQHDHAQARAAQQPAGAAAPRRKRGKSRPADGPSEGQVVLAAQSPVAHALGQVVAQPKAGPKPKPKPKAKAHAKAEPKARCKVKTAADIVLAKLRLRGG